MSTLHQTKAEGRGDETIRANAKLVTPAEAKQVWLMLGQPSGRAVADWFKATGRHVNPATIWKWKQAGWPGASAADITQAAAAALVDLGRVASALRGDGPSAAGVVEPDAGTKDARQADGPPDGRGNAERTEEALRAAVAGATLMWGCISDIAIALRSGAAGGDTHARALVLLGGPGGVAKLMLAASAAINTAVDGFRQLTVLRAEEAAALPRAQTVYPPGQGPHAQIPQAQGLREDGLWEEQDYPSRSTIEAIDEMLRQIRAGKHAAG